jgi:hypothetical protein
MKKIIKIALALLVVGFGIFGVSSIYAYLTAIDNAFNTITVGSNIIEVNEIFEPPIKLEPGISFKKDVKVDNTGISDCYVRIKAVYNDSEMGKYCTLDIDTENFFYNSEDNYYYYIHKLPSGESTPSLFTTVSISEDVPREEVKNFDILIYAESYPAAKFPNYEAAWRHYQKNRPQE